MLALALFTGCKSGRGVQTAVNPLTYTDIPDNDVIRVGNTYYMVSTTMFFCPGAPIMESRDLVHWKTVSYIYDYLEDDDFYNLRNGRNAYGKGQWATSIRYHDGTFYALFIANEQGNKSYVYKTKDIVNGPWERTELNRKFHDASLLFDNGKLYVAYGGGDIRIVELEPDASAIKEGGVDQVLLSSPREGINLRAEGAHFYHIGDYYYVIEISWPRGGCRRETCWRSKELLGPYESKVVLDGPFDGRTDGVAQGAIVDTQFGDWYAIQFQDHGAVGRIPTIQPVTWVDGWPIMGDNTIPMKEVEVKLAPDGEDYVWACDDFDSKELALVWQWNHKPVNEAWSLTERPGWMRLRTSQIATDVTNARNTLTQRTFGPSCTSEVLMDATALKPGDRAGLCAFQSNNVCLGVEVAEDGTKEFVIREQRPRMGENVVYSEPLKSEKIYLKIDYMFTPQEGDTRPADTATVSWSYDGTNWNKTDYTLRMRYTLDFFIGYRSALYCYATTQAGGWADFDYFKQY